jgi:hypothetical protein
MHARVFVSPHCMRLILSAAILSSCTLAAAPAMAAPITETFVINATSFTPGGAPVSPVIGSFTINFDPTLTYNGINTAGFVVNSLNLSVSPTLGFNYTPGVNNGTLIITNSLTGVHPFTNEFSAQIFGADGSSTSLGQVYYAVNTGVVYNDAFQGTATVTLEAPTAVPEPITLWLLGAGVAGMLALRRHSARRGSASLRSQSKFDWFGPFRLA